MRRAMNFQGLLVSVRQLYDRACTRPMQAGRFQHDAPVSRYMCENDIDAEGIDKGLCAYSCHGRRASALNPLALNRVTYDELAAENGDASGIPAYIVDSCMTDGLDSVAHVSCLSGIERTSNFHALNSKAMVRRFAAEQGRRYEDVNCIVAHMGGGITASTHRTPRARGRGRSCSSHACVGDAHA